MTPTANTSNTGAASTRHFNTGGLRVPGRWPPAGGHAGATDVFSLPTPGAAPALVGGMDAGGAAPGTPARTPKPAEKSEKADKGADDDRETDKTDKRDGAAEDKDGSSAQGGSDGVEAGSDGVSPQVPAQPLTIHTLNGLLLTLPATPAPAARVVQARGPANGAADADAGSGNNPDGGEGTNTVSARGATEASGPGGASTALAGSPGRNTEGQQGRAGDRHEDAGVGEVGAARVTTRPGNGAGAGSGNRAPAPSGSAASTLPMAEARPRGPGASNPGTSGVDGVDGVGGVRSGVSMRKTGAGVRAGVPAERTGPAQVVRGMLAAVNQKGGKVTIDLQPGELGRMKVELRLDARTATATFHVDSPQARKLLEEAMPQLRRALTDRGVSLERAEVIAPPPGTELPGALAAISAGAEAIAFVSTEPPGAHADAGRSGRGSDTDSSGGSAGRGGGQDAEPATPAGPGMRMRIGPDGVDVTV
jgi:hypothetical protein